MLRTDRGHEGQVLTRETPYSHSQPSPGFSRLHFARSFQAAEPKGSKTPSARYYETTFASGDTGVYLHTKDASLRKYYATDKQADYVSEVRSCVKEEVESLRCLWT